MQPLYGIIKRQLSIREAMSFKTALKDKDRLINEENYGYEILCFTVSGGLRTSVGGTGNGGIKNIFYIFDTDIKLHMQNNYINI